MSETPLNTGQPGLARRSGRNRTPARKVLEDRTTTRQLQQMMHAIDTSQASNGIFTEVNALNGLIVALTQQVVQLTSELTATRDELMATKNELIATKNELIATKNELIATKNELIATKNELIATKNELIATKNEMTTKNELIATKNEMTKEELPSGVGRHSQEVDRALSGQHTKALYDALDKKEASTLAQLQTGVARLNTYLHQIGVSDTDQCECGRGKETVKHFLFLYPRWDHLRAHLLQQVGARIGDISFRLGGRSKNLALDPSL